VLDGVAHRGQELAAVDLPLDQTPTTEKVAVLVGR
jgi:hypothetical protein